MDHPKRRQVSSIPLTLKEIAANDAIDAAPSASQPFTITTFGNVRETCPQCQNVHLKLVLCQQNVRLPHLLCPTCGHCFDARFPDGASALALTS